MILTVCRRWGILPDRFDVLPREAQAEMVADYRLECEEKARGRRLANLRQGGRHGR